MRLAVLLASLQLMATAGAAAPASPPRATSIAEVMRVTGQVFYGASGTTTHRLAVPGEKLYPGDRILTERGRAAILFPDGSVIHLSRKSSFQVVEATVGRSGGARRIVTRLFAGLARSIVKPFKSDSTFEMRSPSAIAAVKGTDFTFDTRRVVVFDESDAARHEVALSNPGRTDVEIVAENMTSLVRDNGDVETPHRMEPGEIDRERRTFDWREEPAPQPADQPSESLLRGAGEGAGNPAAAHEPEAAAPRIPPEAAAHAAETTLDNPVLHDAIPDAAVPAEAPPGISPAAESMLDRSIEATGASPMPEPPADGTCACD